MPEIDPEFLALPMRRLADAALGRARELGVEHADFRLERIRGQDLILRDGRVEQATDGVTLGVAVRVVREGTWGFAAGVDLTPEAAVTVAEQAIEVARVSRPVNSEPVELADEPVYDDATWVSAYEVNPFEVPDADKIGLLAEWSDGCWPPTASTTSTPACCTVQENKFYADTGRHRTTQQRVRLHPELEATAVDRSRGTFEQMRTIAPPAARGWEYLTGTGWDWDGELAAAPGLAGREGEGALRRPGPLRPGHRPDEPLADHPRVGRPRDRAGPRARLRGRVRGDLASPPSTSSAR